MVRGPKTRPVPKPKVMPEDGETLKAAINGKLHKGQTDLLSANPRKRGRAPAAVAEAVRAEKRAKLEARLVLRQEHFKDITDLGLLGPSWKGSWASLGASRRLLGTSSGHLGRLGPIMRRFEALLERLGSLWEPYWPVLRPSWLRKSHARRLPGPQQACAKPREIWEFGVQAS